MERYGSLVIFLVILLASTGLSAQAPVDAQELADRWTQAYNDHDGDALAGLYTESAELTAHGAPTLTGRDDIRAFWASDFGEGNPLTLLNVTHTIDGADRMLVQGVYEVLDSDHGGALGDGGFVHVWRLGDGGEWRIDRELWFDAVLPYEKL